MQIVQHSNRDNDMQHACRIANDMTVNGYIGEPLEVTCDFHTYNNAEPFFLTVIGEKKAKFTIGGETVTSEAVKGAVPAFVDYMYTTVGEFRLVDGVHRMLALLLAYSAGHKVKPGVKFLNFDSEQALVCHQIAKNLRHRLAKAATYGAALDMCIASEEVGNRVTRGVLASIPNGQGQKIMGIIYCRRSFEKTSTPLDRDYMQSMMELHHTEPSKLASISNIDDFDKAVGEALTKAGVTRPKSMPSKGTLALAELAKEWPDMANMLKAIGTNNADDAKAYAMALLEKNRNK